MCVPSYNPKRRVKGYKDEERHAWIGLCGRCRVPGKRASKKTRDKAKERILQWSDENWTLPRCTCGIQKRISKIWKTHNYMFILKAPPPQVHIPELMELTLAEEMMIARLSCFMTFCRPAPRA